MLYFAYGSNLNTRQMAHRCPGAVPLGPARLADFALVPRRYADIEPRAGAEVYGALWEITDRHLDSLDRYEGCPELYERALATVELLPVGEGGIDLAPVPVPAFVYWMTARARRERDGVPFPVQYRAACAQGAREHRLPVNHYETP